MEVMVVEAMEVEAMEVGVVVMEVEVMEDMEVVAMEGMEVEVTEDMGVVAMEAEGMGVVVMEAEVMEVVMEAMEVGGMEEKEIFILDYMEVLEDFMMSLDTSLKITHDCWSNCLIMSKSLFIVMVVKFFTCLPKM